MKSKQELINIAKKLKPQKSEEKYYRFAESCLNRMINNNKKDSKEFFNIISYMQKNSSNKTIKIAMGISGKDIYKINSWCNTINSSRTMYTGNLTTIELCYVMGYCARMAKCNKETIEKNSNFRGRQNDRQK